MGELRRRIYCRECERKTPHTRPTPSGWGHGIMTLLTGGLWLPIWMAAAVSARASAWECRGCGATRTDFWGSMRYLGVTVFWALVAIVLLGLLIAFAGAV